MEKRTYGNELGVSTRAVHRGNDVDGETGAIRRPITMANSYALPYDTSEMNWSSADKNLYTRNGGSNQKYLEEKLALRGSVTLPLRMRQPRGMSAPENGETRRISEQPGFFYDRRPEKRAVAAHASAYGEFNRLLEVSLSI